MEISDNFRGDLLQLLDFGRDEFLHRLREGPQCDVTAAQHGEFSERMRQIIREYDLAILALKEPVLNFVIHPDE